MFKYNVKIILSAPLVVYYIKRDTKKLAIIIKWDLIISKRHYNCIRFQDQ
jgi:hypothetical protein